MKLELFKRSDLSCLASIDDEIARTKRELKEIHSKERRLVQKLIHLQSRKMGE